MDLGLRDRVAVVTGASRGIGRAVAGALAAEGSDLVLCARREDALREVAAEVEGRGRRAEVVVVDVARAGGAEMIVDRCRRAFGRLDICVNNAGGGGPKRIDRLDENDWRDGFAVNFFAHAWLSGAVVPVMRERGWGRIVNVASTYAREPDPSYAVYSAAKAALLNLTKSLARAHSAEGILTTCVVPGVTLTELVQDNATRVGERTGRSADDVMAEVMARDPVAAGRFGTVEEVAAAVVFLASERAGWISGAALAVDGSTLRSI